MAEGGRDNALMNEQSKEGNLDLYVSKLKFVDGKRPKFYWLGTKEELVNFITLLDKIEGCCKLVLHVGTNDLANSTSHEVADSIIDLADYIESKYSGISVTLSEIVQRYDSMELKGQVNETNKIINKFCKQSGRALIKHDSTIILMNLA